MWWNPVTKHVKLRKKSKMFNQNSKLNFFPHNSFGSETWRFTETRADHRPDAEGKRDGDGGWPQRRNHRFEAQLPKHLTVKNNVCQDSRFRFYSEPFQVCWLRSRKAAACSSSTAFTEKNFFRTQNAPENSENTKPSRTLTKRFERSL